MNKKTKISEGISEPVVVGVQRHCAMQCINGLCAPMGPCKQQLFANQAGIIALKNLSSSKSLKKAHREGKSKTARKKDVRKKRTARKDKKKRTKVDRTSTRKRQPSRK